MKKIYCILLTVVMLLSFSSNVFAADTSSKSENAQESKLLVTVPLQFVPQDKSKAEEMGLSEVSCNGILNVSGSGTSVYGDWSVTCNSKIIYCNMFVTWSGSILDGGGGTDYFNYPVNISVYTIRDEAQNLYLKKGTYTATLGGNVTTFDGIAYTVRATPAVFVIH